MGAVQRRDGGARIRSTLLPDVEPVFAFLTRFSVGLRGLLSVGILAITLVSLRPQVEGAAFVRLVVAECVMIALYAVAWRVLVRAPDKSKPLLLALPVLELVGVTGFGLLLADLPSVVVFMYAIIAANAIISYGYKAALPVTVAVVGGNLLTHVPHFDEPTALVAWAFQSTLLVALGVGIGYAVWAYEARMVRLHEEQRRSLSRVIVGETVSDINRELGGSLDLTAILEAALRRLGDLLGAKDGGVVLHDTMGASDTEDALYRVAANLGDALTKFGARVRLEEVPWGRFLVDKRRTLVVSVEEGNTEERALARDRGWEGYLAAPLYVQGRVEGWIWMGCPDLKHLKQGYMRDAIGDIVTHTGVAVSHAHFYKSTQRRAEQLGTLRRISRAFASTLSAEELFETIHREIANILDFDSFFIALSDGNECNLRIVFLVDEEGRHPEMVIPLNDGPTSRVFRTGQSVLVHRSPSEPMIPGSSLIGAEQRGTGRETLSLITVPIRNEGRVIGTLSVQSSTERAYTRDDSELLGTVADEAGVMLEKARLFEKTVTMSITDELTGLGNARLLQQRLKEMTEEARRLEEPLSLVMLDSDSLKAVNDRFGHEAGNKLIMALSEVIRGVIRSSDVAVRYAGDEFLIILPATGVGTARNVAERICRAVESHRVLIAGQECRSTVSMGVATFPDHAADADSLLRRVDEAMYKSKRQGRNRVTLAAS